MSTTNEPLRPVTRGSLNLGGTLPGAILDQNGTVLAPAGTPVDLELIDRLCQLLGMVFYVGSDWPENALEDDAEPPPGTVIDSLHEDHDSAWAGDESRVSSRHSWNVPVSITIEESRGGFVSRREIEVNTNDLSRGGYSFTSNSYVHEEAIIRAQFDMLPNRPELVGVVRFCIHLSGTQYRVGVQFMQKVS